MSDETEGRAPAGEAEGQSAEVGEPERGGGEETPGRQPDFDARQERIRTERKPAGPPLEEAGDEEAVRGEDEEPPEVDPEEE
jgi:hypothetical protein